MTHQFLGIFKTHAANMHNHLIHSAETSTDTQIQNSFLAIRILRYGKIAMFHSNSLAPGFSTPFICQDLPLCNTERRTLSGGAIYWKQVMACFIVFSCRELHVL